MTFFFALSAWYKTRYTHRPLKIYEHTQADANTDGSKKLSLHFLSCCALVKKILCDLENVVSLISLHHYTVARGGAGAVQRCGQGDLQRQGSAAETGLHALDNTAAFDGAWTPLFESASCSASNRSATDSIANNWI